MGVNVDVDVDLCDDKLWMQMDAHKLDGDSGVCARKRRRNGTVCVVFLCVFK